MPRQFRCKTCYRTFRSKSSLARHKDEEHGPELCTQRKCAEPAYCEGLCWIHYTYRRG